MAFIGIVPNTAFSEVVMNGTRVVFYEKDNEVTIQLKNKGTNPYLLQMWFDNGNPKSKPGDVIAPFIITPPVVRIDTQAGQAVRIISNKADLDKQKESLFWFNMIEIPPEYKSNKKGENAIQLAFRTRVKFFYRPTGLKMKPLEAYKKLEFKIDNRQLQVLNKTPYHVTFKEIKIIDRKSNEKVAFVKDFNKRMLEPGKDMTLLLKQNNTNLGPANRKIVYTVINDFGGETINELDIL